MKVCLPAIVIFMMVANVSHAQAPADSILRVAKAGNWYVRATGSNLLAEGRVPRVDTDSVSIGDSRLSLLAIEKVERRSRVGGGAKRGALIGGAIVGTFGAALAAGFCESTNCSAQQGGAFVGGALIGGLFGGLIGEAARPGRHEWKQMWPQREP